MTDVTINVSLEETDVPTIAVDLLDGPHAHRDLTGLPFGDDHPQYLTPVRGDARYDAAGDAANAIAVANAYTDAGLAGVVPLTMRGAANGVATLDGMGQIPSNQLPPLAISQPFVVANQAARLALAAQRGDTALQSDDGSWWILATDDPTVPVNWKSLTPPGIVTSVNGHAGPAVNLTYADVGAAANDDPRLTNARVPLAHAATHAPGAGDSINAYYVSKAGGDTILAAGLGVVPLTMQGAVGQTADLTQWRDSTNALKAHVSWDGSIYGQAIESNSTLKSFGAFSVFGAQNGVVQATVRGAFGQTASIQEWQDSTGVAKLKIKPDGGIDGTSAGNSTLSINWGNAYWNGAQMSAGPGGPGALSGAAISAGPGAAQIGIVVRAAAAQTAHLQQWQNSGGTSVASINAAGRASLSGGADIFTSLYTWDGFNAQNQAPTVTPIVVKGNATQTADLQQWQDNTGAVLARVRSNGDLDVHPGTSALGTLTIADASIQKQFGSGFTFGSGINSLPYLGVGMGVSGTSLKVGIATGSDTNVGLLVRGFSPTQSADLQQWQNNVAGVLTRVTNSGHLGVNALATAAMIATVPDAVGTVGIVAKAAVGQTANVQEWQDSTGAMKASVDAGGNITGNRFVGQVWAPYMTTSQSGASYGGAWNMQPQVATQTGFVIRGLPSQSGDLQQWQDSTGAVKANIDSLGIIYSLAFRANAISATGVPIIVQGFTGQSGDLTQWRNNSSTVLTRIDPSGRLSVQPDGVGAFGSANAAFGVVPHVVGAVGIAVKALASQAGDLQQWQDSAGNVLSRIAASGAHYTQSVPATNTTQASPQPIVFASAYWNGVASTTEFFQIHASRMGGQPGSAGAYRMTFGPSANPDNNKVSIAGDGSHSVAVGDAFAQASQSGQLFVTPNAASRVGVVVRGAASQTSDLQQWQSSGLALLAKIDSNGSLTATGITSSGTGQFGGGNFGGTTVSITTANATSVGAIIRGVAGQSADLQQWQDNTGSVLSGINASGNLRVVSPGYGSSLSVGTPAVGQVNAIIRGIASQTADLTQWQDSGGGVLAFVSAGGQINAGSVGANSLRQRGGGTDRIFLNSGTVAATVQNLLGATAVPLVAQGFAGQSNDLTQWTDSSGNVLARLTNAGGLVAGITNNGHLSFVPGTFPTMLYMDPTNTSAAQLIFSGTAAANNGSTYYDVGPSGSFNIRGAMNDSQRIRMTVGGNGQVLIGGAGAADNPAVTPLLVRGVTAQTADLQQWQNPSGAMARITAVGGIVANAGGPTSLADGSYDFDLSGNSVNAFRLKQGNGSRTMTINNAGMAFSTTGTFGSANWGGIAELEVVNELATRVGLMVKGIASQSADLQQWQNSAGTVLAKVGAAGAAQFAAAHVNTAGLGATLDVVTAGAAVVPIIARGAAAQTANMQEWQNSGGTVLAMQKANGEYEQTVNAVAASDAGGGTGGIVLRAPNGTRYRVTVSNVGAVLATAA